MNAVGVARSQPWVEPTGETHGIGETHGFLYNLWTTPPTQWNCGAVVGKGKTKNHCETGNFLSP